MGGKRIASLALALHLWRIRASDAWSVRAQQRRTKAQQGTTGTTRHNKAQQWHNKVSHFL
eukprot:scaffold71398_cov41-Cyclotella_meneghiniana.AAC.3